MLHKIVFIRVNASLFVVSPKIISKLDGCKNVLKFLENAPNISMIVKILSSQKQE